MLPDRRQKHKWNVASCSWKTKLGILHTEQNCLLALLTFVHGTEGDRDMLPSSASRNGSIDAARALLEAQIERDFMQLAGKAEHFGHGKKNYLLAIFTFVNGEEGGRATSSSSESRNGSINASILSLEVQMERDFMQLEGEVGNFAQGKKIPACAFHLCSWLRGR